LKLSIAKDEKEVQLSIAKEEKEVQINKKLKTNY
jgi:hypothetical protein